MARSARKIFQNKAIDGNYISTLGTNGMRTLSALCKKTPLNQTDARHRGLPGLEAGGLWVPIRTGGWEDLCSGWRFSIRRPSRQPVGLWGTLEFALHVSL